MKKQQKRHRQIPRYSNLEVKKSDLKNVPTVQGIEELGTSSQTSFRSAVVDITEHKLSEQMFRGLLETSPDARVIVNEKGNIVLINAQTERVFGYKREELYGKPIEILIPARYRGRHVGFRGDYSASPRARPMGAGLELFALRKDGTEFPVEISLSPLQTEEGVLISTVIRDITERKRMEEILRTSEERTRLIIETANDAFIEMDEKGLITDWNQQAEVIFGWKRAEAIGHLVTETIIPSFKRQQEHGDGLQRFLTTEKGPILNKRVEFMAIHRDGHEFPVELTIWVIHTKDARRFNAFIRDIAQRKQLEAEVLNISTRERQQVGQDLHDGLGQHLSGISFLTKALEQRLAQKSLEHEVKQAASIVQLINEAILQVKTLARGLYPVELQANGLMSALQELASDTERLFKISCVFECDRTSQIYDHVVATHLYRIVQEAVHNAVKHSQAKHIWIHLSRENNEICLSVEDDGVGLSKESVQSKGMGLHIMGYRAQMIGAALNLQTTGKGCTVVVRLPHQPSKDVADLFHPVGKGVVSASEKTKVS